MSIANLIRGGLVLTSEYFQPIVMLLSLIFLAIFFIVGITFFTNLFIFGGLGLLLVYLASRMEMEQATLFVWIGIAFIIIGALTSILPPNQYGYAYAAGAMIIGIVIAYKIDLIDGKADLHPAVYLIIGAMIAILAFILTTKEYTVGYNYMVIDNTPVTATVKKHGWEIIQNIVDSFRLNLVKI